MRWQYMLRELIGRVYVVSAVVAPLTQDPSPEGNLPAAVLDAYMVCMGQYGKRGVICLQKALTCAHVHICVGSDTILVRGFMVGGLVIQ